MAVRLFYASAYYDGIFNFIRGDKNTLTNALKSDIMDTGF